MNVGINRLRDIERSIEKMSRLMPRSLGAPKRRSKNRRAVAKTLRFPGHFAFNIAVDYDVPGTVPVIKQPTPMSCWATVTTMLMSWRDQMSYSIETALQKIGDPWLKLFEADKGLKSADKPVFLAASGLIAEAPQSFSLEGWENLLRTFGPIWVTTDEKPGAGWAIHARLITGIHGDGTAENTFLKIIDPGTGTAYREKVSVFIPKFEEEVVKTGHMRIQIVHFPSDTVSIPKSKSLRTDATRFSVIRSALSTDEDLAMTDGELSDGESVSMVRMQTMLSTAMAKKRMGASDAKWAPDHLAPDYRHLNAAGLSQCFSFAAQNLADLCKGNQFDVTAGQDEVVFGLRGCRLLEPVNDFVMSIQLSEDIPDHQDNHCVIGVWRRSDNKIIGFQGSTVPNWKYMEKYRQGQAYANLLPTGRYRYKVGTHGASKARPQPGALREEGDMVVLRTQDDLTYTVHDKWDKGNFGDNIHSGRLNLRGVNFSSAGCQTIPGDYDQKNERPLKNTAWHNFRKALHLNNEKPGSKDGTKFIYVLLTGREARMFSNGLDSSAWKRLRFGSSGPDVEALQLGLKNAGAYKGNIDGDFGPLTSWALIEWQKKQNGGAADAIVTPALARKLNFDMIAQQSIQQGWAYGLGLQPWSRYFQFPEKTRFKVDGPYGYDGEGLVMERNDTLLKFGMKMPEYTVPLLGHKIPKSDMTFEISYRKEGDGNHARIIMNGQLIEDPNLKIQSDNKENRRTIIPSVATLGHKLHKITVAPDGDNEIDLDIALDDDSWDFDLKRIST